MPKTGFGIMRRPWSLCNRKCLSLYSDHIPCCVPEKLTINYDPWEFFTYSTLWVPIEKKKRSCNGVVSRCWSKPLLSNLGYTKVPSRPEQKSFIDMPPGIEKPHKVQSMRTNLVIVPGMTLKVGDSWNRGSARDPKSTTECSRFLPLCVVNYLCFVPPSLSRLLFTHSARPMIRTESMHTQLHNYLLVE